MCQAKREIVSLIKTETCQFNNLAKEIIIPILIKKDASY